MSKVEDTYCFLVNCASNAFRAEALFKRHEEKLKELFPGSVIIYVQKEDSIKQIAHEKSQTYSCIIACGGDGTVNQAANGIMGSSAKLGVLPLGSGNDFAKTLDLNTDFYENLDVLLKGITSNIDVLKNDWGYVLNTFGIGVDGLTNYHATNSIFRKGTLRYFWAGLTALFHAKPFIATISIPEKDFSMNYRAWMVVVANGKTEGGKYTISPNSLNNDGKVEAIVVKDISRMRLILEFLKLSFGLSFNKGIIDEFVITKTLSIETDRKVKAHADGEQVSVKNKYHFKLVKGAIQTITNR